MSKVNMTHELKKDSRLGRLVCACAATLPDNSPFFPNTRDADGNLVLDLRLVCNGVEVDAVPWLERWAQEYDEHVQWAAHDLFEEKFRDATNGIYETLETVRKAIRAKFNIPREEDE